MMNKTAVVFWSGTGNTEEMARLVAQGVKEKGAECTVYTSAEFEPSFMDSFDAVAFGCPSMGVEVLEEEEFEPVFAACEEKLKQKPIGLFGSFGWGDGEWMRNWEERCRNDGAILVHESIICNGAPDEKATASCRALGRALAEKK